jgi:hypothetical protein
LAGCRPRTPACAQLGAHARGWAGRGCGRSRRRGPHPGRYTSQTHSVPRWYTASTSPRFPSLVSTLAPAANGAPPSLPAQLVPAPALSAARRVGSSISPEEPEEPEESEEGASSDPAMIFSKPSWNLPRGERAGSAMRGAAMCGTAAPKALRQRGSRGEVRPQNLRRLWQAAEGGTRRVQLLRGEGRDVSSYYEGRDETCPVSTGGRGRGGGGEVCPQPPGSARCDKPSRAPPRPHAGEISTV